MAKFVGGGRRFFLLLASLALSVGATTSWGQVGTATMDLLPFYDPNSSVLGDQPLDVNNAGVAVGYSGDGDYYYRGVKWNAAGAVSSLGADPDYEMTVATSISRNSKVICGYGLTVDTFSGQAFIWTPTEGIRRLPDLVTSPGTFDDHSEAQAVSDDASTIWGATTISGAPSQIVKWDAVTLDGTLVGALDGSSGANQVFDCSNNGNIAVGYAEVATGLRAIRVTPNGISALPRVAGGGDAIGLGIDSNGSTIVGYQYQSSGTTPFIWRSGAGTSALPRLKASSIGSYAYHLSDAGVVVGFDGDPQNLEEQIAILWIAERPFSLRSYLQNQYGLNLAAWADICAVGSISRDGRYLAGWGIRDGYLRAFRVKFTGNRPPVANAGADVRKTAKNASGIYVTLDGRKSADPDGQTIRYLWTGIKFDDKRVSRPRAKFPVGTTTVTLEAKDPAGATSTDTVKVIVKLAKSSIRPQGLAANDSFARASTLTATLVRAGDSDGAVLAAAEQAAAADAIGAAIGDAFVWEGDTSAAGAAADYAAARLLQSAYGQAAAAALADAYVATGDPAYAAAYRSAVTGTEHALADLADG